MKGKGPLRFQKVERFISESIWHQPSSDTHWTGASVTYVAMCGYTVHGVANVRWSKAKTPRGRKCQSCERSNTLREEARRGLQD